MKLYAAPTPRSQGFYRASDTPASAYALEQDLKKAYREVSREWWDLDRLILACFGPRTGKRLAAAEDRLQYEVPELLERMSPAELQVAAHVFCQGTLVGFIWHVLSQERTIQHRLGEGNCSTRLSDDSHAKAAGLGKSKPARKKTKPVVQRTPTPAPVKTAPRPALRVQHSPRYWSQVRQQSQLSLWPPLGVN
ncbi:hypothetical protein [Hymenobacter tenuis]